jgi:hypothetical protein
MKHIYLISGLGADERVFKHLDLSGYKATYIQWLKPEKHESITSYAERLCGQITTTKPILIGLSFGGIMAVEIAKCIDTEKIILISSIKTRKEIPRGTADKILPLTDSTNVKTLQGGEHFMVWNRAAEVNNFLKEILVP